MNYIIEHYRVLVENYYARLKGKFTLYRQVFRGKIEQLPCLLKIAVAITNYDISKRPLRREPFEEINYDYSESSSDDTSSSSDSENDNPIVADEPDAPAPAGNDDPAEDNEPEASEGEQEEEPRPRRRRRGRRGRRRNAWDEVFPPLDETNSRLQAQLERNEKLRRRGGGKSDSYIIWERMDEFDEYLFLFKSQKIIKDEDVWDFPDGIRPDYWLPA